ncbi:MAG TPA: biotin/lipoyl-binding protein, partial [Negativicutes bacterium]|nr:biotin/lipoyl-binding protein [Negativicutes bacterium]
KYLIIAIVIVSAAVGIFAFANTDRSGPEVTVYKASRMELQKTIELTGTVNAVDYEEITPVSGSKVLKVYVVENQDIKQGQVLAELDPGDMEYSLDKLEINGKQLKRELAELQEPSTVSGLQSLKNKAAKAEATSSGIERKLKELDEEVEKAKRLFMAGAAAEDDYKERVSDREDMAEELLKAQIELDNARNELADYDRNMKFKIESKKSEIESNEADINSLKKQLSDTMIKAGTNGSLAEFPLKEGRTVEDGSIIRIYDMSQLSLKGLLAQEDAVLVRPGQKASVMLKGLDKEYEAEVYGVKRYAALDKNSASLTPKVEVELRLLAPDEAVGVGFEADAEIVVEKAMGVLVVPRESVRKTAEGKSEVFLVKEGILKTASVTTGVFDDYMVEMRSGISEGDMVVTNTPEGLKAGEHVTVRQE